MGLMAHHLFGCWHGDYRLRRKHGAAFDAVQARTSLVPFQAVWEGRQVLPPDYYKVRCLGGEAGVGGVGEAGLRMENEPRPNPKHPCTRVRLNATPLSILCVCRSFCGGRTLRWCPSASAPTWRTRSCSARPTGWAGDRTQGVLVCDTQCPACNNVQR